MLPRPAVSFGSTILNDTVVILVSSYDVINASDICGIVTFPLMARSTVAPVPVVAGTVVADGVGVGDEVGIGDGVVISLGVGVGVGDGVVVGEGDGVGVGANVAEMVFEA